MPRRSNDFQRLIRLIFAQLAPTGARVTESALLAERTSGVEREVDVLIQHAVAGVEMVIAVECRDHARGVDVQWIDALVGKYRDLPVDRVVAVSRRKFSGAARAKAAANRIESRTLRSALETHWPDELDYVEMGHLSVRTVFKIVYQTEPPWIDTTDAPEFCDVGGRKVQKRDADKSLTDKLRQMINKDVHSRLGSAVRVGGHCEVLEQAFEVTSPVVELITKSGQRYRVRRILVYTHTEVNQRQVPTRHEVLETVGITTGHFELEKSGDLEVSLIQTPGTPVTCPAVFPLDAGTLPADTEYAAPTDRLLFSQRSTRRKRSKLRST